MIDKEKVLRSLECCLKFCETNGQECVFCDYFPTGCNALKKDILAMLNEQPEIVRCKDCANLGNHNICPVFSPTNDFYCGHGRKRND